MIGAYFGSSIGARIGTATSQAQHQYNEYMRKLMDNAANSINPSIKLSPSHITMTLEEFQKIPVSSGDELLNVIKTMCRLQGVDMEDATSLNVNVRLERGIVDISIHRKLRVDMDLLYASQDAGSAARK